ncbi:MAG: hypothetical protein IME96_12930 [Proteobacteria bacterium]|nr:hypothetical protein [Pseudomonadota bacterium]
MHIEFVEKINTDGNFEITIEKGSEGLKKEIAGKYTFPQKLILTKVQREENKDGLMDILTGAFCLQEIQDVTFIVRDEQGEPVDEYNNSLYADIRHAGHS